MIQDLPQELVDYCIDFLHDCGISLRACCLTSKAWIPASRHHLFESLLLEYSAQFTAITELLHDQPKLASFMRQLRLGDFVTSPTTLPPGAALWDDLVSSPFVDVPELLSRLTRVVTLELWCVSSKATDSSSPLLRQCITPLRSQVKYLIIHHTRFVSQDELIDFVAFFPNVEKLRLDGVGFDNLEPITLQGAPSSLVQLELRWFRHMWTLTNWFQSIRGRISSLVLLTLKDSGEARAMAEILEVFGPSISYLNITSRRWFEG